MGNGYTYKRVSLYLPEDFMPFVQADGIRIYYEKYGEGQPVVFVHPPLMGHVVFHYQKVLACDYQIILYDLRGHGRSSYRFSRGYDTVISENVRDLRSLITELHISDPVIVGYSNGGLIALAYACNYRDDVRALILSGGYPTVDSLLLSGEYQAGVLLMILKQKRLLSLLLAFSHQVKKSDREYLFHYAMKAEYQAVLDLYRAGRCFNAVDQLPSLQSLPLLVLYGTRDRFVSKHKKYFASLSCAEIVYIDHAFHQLPMRQYDVFNRLVDRFIKDRPGK